MLRLSEMPFRKLTNIDTYTIKYYHALNTWQSIILALRSLCKKTATAHLICVEKNKERYTQQDMLYQ